MGEIHNLITARGKIEARRIMDPALVDIASAVLGEEDGGRDYTYSGLCLTSLPHRKIADDSVWERRGNKVRLLIEPGRLQVGGEIKQYGVPYGARARMILIYLVTQAVKSNSREIVLGSSMRNWLERMDVSVGGETAKAFKEQSLRIAACNMKFFWESNNGGDGFDKGGIVRRGLVFPDTFDLKERRQASLFDDVVVLDEVFYKAVREHPVPLLEEAIKQLSDRSMSLDIYCWLAYRLHSLKGPTPITWSALHHQFGGGFKETRGFKKPFVAALNAALAAYPEAQVEPAHDDKGIVLHPSRPPIGYLLSAR